MYNIFLSYKTNLKLINKKNSFSQEKSIKKTAYSPSYMGISRHNFCLNIQEIVVYYVRVIYYNGEMCVCV